MKNIFFLLLILIVGCKENPTSQVLQPKTEKPYAIVIHGGAGGVTPERFPPDLEGQYREKLNEALQAGYSLLESGASAVEAVQAAVVILEDSPLFNAGKGAVYNNKAQQEMDASIMDGSNRNAGAVAGVRHIKNPILAARLVMDSSRHVLLTGVGAEKLCQSHGVELVDTAYFFSQGQLDQLRRVQQRELLPTTGSLDSGLSHDYKYGTVGAVALDRQGHIAAATSTGGLTNKKYGRIGDSPIIGAGTYADDATCGVSATGTGEFFIRAVAAHSVSGLMRYKSYSIEKAIGEVIHTDIQSLGGDGGLIALDHQGNIAWDFNTKGMFRGYKKSDGSQKIALFGK